MRPLAKRYEEPFGLWRATMRRGEGAPLQEVLASLQRFEDLSVKWWRTADRKEAGELGVLTSKAARKNFSRARVAVLEEGRRERARDVKLERVGRGPYRANDRYLVDAIFGLYGCKDFERHNGKKKGRKEADFPLVVVVVRCKHLIAAEEAEGEAHRSDHAPGPGRSASPLLLGFEARSKLRGSRARGGPNP